MIIGLNGKAGSGKDTVADFLVTKGWKRYAMAGPLKRGISAMLNIPMLDIEDPKIKNEPNYKYGRSIRYLAQTLGTEWGRNLIADDLWIQVARENISDILSHGYNVVITDIRFENEVELINELGGQIIQIIRPENSATNIIDVSGVKNHISESGIRDDYIDYIIKNDASLVSLFLRTEEVLLRLKN